jgi:hypothetical protein
VSQFRFVSSLFVMPSVECILDLHAATTSHLFQITIASVEHLYLDRLILLILILITTIVDWASSESDLCSMV